MVSFHFQWYLFLKKQKMKLNLISMSREYEPHLPLNSLTTLTLKLAGYSTENFDLDIEMVRSSKDWRITYNTVFLNYSL